METARKYETKSDQPSVDGGQEMCSDSKRIARRVIPAVDAQPIELARKEVERAKGNRQQAFDALRAMIDQDEALFKAVMRPLMDQAIWSLIREVDAANRRTAFKSVTTPSKPEVAPKNNDLGVIPYTAAEVRANVKNALTNWFLVPIFGGKPLGDATVDDLDMTTEEYRKRANTLSSRADFFAAVRTKVKKGKTVYQSMGIADIEKIAREVIAPTATPADLR